MQGDAFGERARLVKVMIDLMQEMKAHKERMKKLGKKKKVDAPPPQRVICQ